VHVTGELSGVKKQSGVLENQYAPAQESRAAGRNPAGGRSSSNVTEIKGSVEGSK